MKINRYNMSTTKGLAQTLGSMVNQATGGMAGGFTGGFSNGGFTGGYGISEDSIPAELQDPEPVFEINFKATKKNCIKKAKKEIQLLVKEVVPEQYQHSELILDKIEQDAEQLGTQYYLQQTKDTTYQALLNTIGRGETQARMFEVSEKMAKSLEDLGQKITEMQNQIRKYYIDTYLDMQQKIETEDIVYSNAPRIAAAPETKPLAIESQEQKPSQNDNETTYVGTNDLLEHLLSKKKNKYKNGAMDATIVE